MRRDQGLGLLGSASLQGPFQNKDVLEVPQVAGSGCNRSAPYLNLFGLFCPSFSITQLPHLSHPPGLRVKVTSRDVFINSSLKAVQTPHGWLSHLQNLVQLSMHLVHVPLFHFILLFSRPDNSSESPGQEPGVWRAQLAVPGCHCLAKQIPSYSAGLLGRKT